MTSTTGRPGPPRTRCPRCGPGTSRGPGRPGDAVPVLEEALAGSELVRGADHIDTLAAREEYAAAALAAGQTAEAVRSYRHALADRERIQGSQHPGAASASLGLAAAYLASGQ